MAARFRIFRSPPAALAALPAALAALHCGPAAAQPPGTLETRAAARPRVIECPADDSAAASCAADLTTYLGWRVFERYCADCHGADAEGSTFAPSLVHRLQRFDRRDFERALDDGYAGPLAPMRPWGENREVARYYTELWAYLSGRASGDVPPVPLTPLDERSAE